MSPRTPRNPSPKAQAGAARVELISQWDKEGNVTTRRPRNGAEPLDGDRCTWVHTRMPEVDAQGKRTTRTNWESASAHLRQVGLSPPEPPQQSALGAPLSSKPGVYTALGASVVTARDNRFGSREVVRLTRISLVPIDSHLLMSARHRDGLDWVEPIDGQEAPAMRESALRKRDPYRPTSLLASIDAHGRVSAFTGPDELAIEVILAATQAYPRAIVDKLSRMLTLAEEHLANSGPVDDLDTQAQPRTLSTLLHLIASVGRLEQEVSEVRDDFENRTRARGMENVRSEAVEANLRRTLDALARIRGDARTTVDMIGSTRASAHLQIARQETREASAQRARQSKDAEERRAAESVQREREQGLVRTLALLTSVLLIPTLVASVFGANVTLPREGSVWKTWLMLACMIGLGSISYAVLREFDPTRDPPGGLARIVPYASAVVALLAGVVIALEGLGTG